MVDEALDTEGLVEDGAEEMEQDTGAEGEDPLEDLSGQLKLLTSHFQVLSGGGKSLNIKWPGTAAGLVRLANYFNVDVFAIFSIDCVERWTHFDKLHAFIAAPALFMGVFVGMYLVVKNFTDMDTDAIKNFAWSKFMVLMFIMYPMLCTNLLAVFQCREIDGLEWLEADLTIQCYTESWTNEAILTLVFIVIFPFGVPAMTYTLLSRNRHRLHIDAKFSKRLGFVYNRYEETYWFWECTEMLRKFLICGCMIFIAPGTMLQLCFSIVAGAFFLSIHFKFQPFDDDLDDNLQTAALLASFLTLVTTVLVRSNEGGGATVAFLLIVNLGVLATALYGLVQDTIPEIVEEYTDYYDQIVGLKETLEAAAEELALLEEASQAPDQGATTGAVAAVAVAKVSSADTAKDAAKEPAEPVQEAESKSAPEPEPDADLEKQIQKLFLRYDLDGSGTINSFDELEQLCCNLGYRLELELNPKQIDTIIAQVKAESPTIEWDLATFSSWFRGSFGLSQK